MKQLTQNVELPFTLTAVPDVTPLWEYTLTISGGTPYGKAIPYYYHEPIGWLPIFDPNVVPYIGLDANGKATYVFKSPSNYFLTVDIKVLGSAPSTPLSPLLILGIGAAVILSSIFVALKVVWKK